MPDLTTRRLVAEHPAPEPAPAPQPAPAPTGPVIPSQPGRDDRANDPPRKIW